MSVTTMSTERMQPARFKQHMQNGSTPACCPAVLLCCLHRCQNWCPTYDTRAKCNACLATKQDAYMTACACS